MFSHQGASAFKKGLENTLELCKTLGNPQQKYPTIHIAGTNGKGSVSHMIAAVLQTAGYKTGLYTSPHLKDFRERIKVNGTVCSEEFVIRFTERISPLIESIEPSFFEITVAMALAYFAEQQVDIAVIEVGLGGRLDSTNIITPQLSIITNIGLDHTQMLGDTLDKIAFEKAGIIKEGVPAIIGEVHELTRPVFEQKAAEVNTQISFAQEQRFVTDWQYNHHHLIVTVADKRTDERKSYELDLPGIYQTKNIITVLSAIHQLQSIGYSIDQRQLQQALKQVKHLTGLHGRWELIAENPAVILDVAHNEDGIKQLVQQIELATYQDLHLIIGMVKDKDIDVVLSLLPQAATYYFTRAQIPRALPEAELALKANAAGLQGKHYPEVNMALKEARTHAHKDDLILICGSVFLVAEVTEV